MNEHEANQRMRTLLEALADQLQPWKTDPSPGGAIDWYCGGCSATWYHGNNPWHKPRCIYTAIRDTLAAIN